MIAFPLLCLTPLGLQFAHLDRDATRAVVGWWKPQRISSCLIAREETVRNYVKAVIDLNDADANVSGLISSDLNMFVVTVEKNVCELRSCLWQPNAARSDTLGMLRQWIFDKGYTCVAVLDGDDRKEWDSS